MFRNMNDSDDQFLRDQKSTGNSLKESAEEREKLRARKRSIESLVETLSKNKYLTADNKDSIIARLESIEHINWFAEQIRCLEYVKIDIKENIDLLFKHPDIADSISNILMKAQCSGVLTEQMRSLIVENIQHAEYISTKLETEIALNNNIKLTEELLKMIIANAAYEKELIAKAQSSYIVALETNIYNGKLDFSSILPLANGKIIIGSSDYTGLFDIYNKGYLKKARVGGDKLIPLSEHLLLNDKGEVIDNQSLQVYFQFKSKLRNVIALSPDQILGLDCQEDLPVEIRYSDYYPWVDNNYLCTMNINLTKITFTRHMGYPKISSLIKMDDNLLAVSSNDGVYLIEYKYDQLIEKHRFLVKECYRGGNLTYIKSEKKLLLVDSNDCRSKIHVWDIDTKKYVQQIRHDQSIDGAVILPDGRTFSFFGRYRKTLYLVDLVTGAKKIKEMSGAIQALSVLPNGDLAVLVEGMLTLLKFNHIENLRKFLQTDDLGTAVTSTTKELISSHSIFNTTRLPKVLTHLIADYADNPIPLDLKDEVLDMRMYA